jgi:O-antigen/teichoic acid export membrane protein
MFVLHHGYGLLGVFWIFVVGELLLAGAYLLVIDRTIERVHPRFDSGTWRELGGTISTFFGASMAGIGLRRLDVVILSKLRDSTAVGLYTAPFKLVDALMGLQAMLPSMARFSSDQRDSLRLMTLRSVKFFTVFLLPVALCVTLVSRDVFARYYSAEFEASGLLLQVLVWSVIPFFVFGVLRNAIIVEGHEKVALRIAVTNLAVSLVLNLVLVPYLGPLGTAISMLVTTFTQAVQAFLFTHRRLMRLDVARTVARPCLAMCIVGGLAWLALRWGWSHTAVLPSALVAYWILIVLFRVLSADEVSFLARIPRQLGRS